MINREQREASTEVPVAETKPSSAPSEITAQTIDQIKYTLLNPRAISKKYDAGGRSETARTVIDAKTKTMEVQGKKTKKETALQHTTQKAQSLEVLKKEKSQALGQRLETITIRLKQLLRIKDASAAKLKAEISAIESEMEQLIIHSRQTQDEIEESDQELAGLPDAKKMLEAYYAKMETVPLSNEEKRQLLRPEVLSELSTGEYIALWRRLNPHFLTHVTGQGFRDHNAAWFHSGGMHELCDGFRETLQDEKLLRAPLGIRDLRTRDELSVRNFLQEWALKAETEKEAKERLDAQLHRSIASAPKYPDKTAVHFATQLVADDFYGGERGNEIFFVYPSDVVASQYDFAFNGSEKDFTHIQSEAMWNDVFVWPTSTEKPGIPVDSGVAFLPSDIPVDPETGSKYASEIKMVDGVEKRAMVEDEKLVSAFVEWAENLTAESSVIQAYKKYDESRNDYGRSREDRERECLEVFRSEIMKLGFDEETATDITRQLFSSSDGICQFQYEGKLGFGDTKGKVAINQLRSAAANWKRAENSVTAREYWERYFEQNPKQKPQHVVFYDGDPTTAIYKFQQRYNIGLADVSKTEGNLLGFGDRHVENMSEDPRANQGLSELEETAYRIISEHYGKQGA